MAMIGTPGHAETRAFRAKSIDFRPEATIASNLFPRYLLRSHPASSWR